MADERTVDFSRIGTITIKTEISGQDKIDSLKRGIDSIVSDRRFQDYWKTQEALIEQVGKAFERFQSDSRSYSYAEDLVKNVNALKAVSGQDLSGLFDNAQQIQSAFNKASEAIGATADAFSYEKFRDVFGVFEEWQKGGKDVASIMDNLQNAIQNVSQTKALADANMELERLKNELAEANDTIQRLGDTSQVAVLTDQISDLNSQIDAIRDKAKGEVLDFLKANDIAEWDERVQYALNNVTSGYTTAKEAIAEIRAEFSEVFQATKDGGFDSSQVAQFSAKLDDIIARVAEIKTAIASGDFSGLKEMNDDMSRGAQLSGEEKGAIEGLSESTRALGESATGTSASFSSLLDVIKEIGNVGSNTLTSFSIAMQSAAKVGGDKFNAKQVVNLAEALNALGQVKNITGISSLSGLRFEGLKELKVSKAALSNLAEFLPKIGQANIERIKALSELDFTNLSNLKVNKSSVETIKEFTDAVNSVRELGEALDNISPKLDQINTAAAQALGRDLNTAADAAHQTAAAVGQMNAEMNAKSGNSVLTALEGIPGLTDDAMLRMAGSIDRATVGVKEIKANLVETNDGAQNMVNLMVKGQNALGQSVQYLFRYNQETGEIDSKLVSISQKFDQVKNSTEAASSAQKNSKDMTEEESQALDRQKASLKEIEQIQRAISTSYGKTQGALTNSLDLFNDSGQMVLEKQHRIDELRSKYLELTEAIEAYKRSGASATPEEADRIRTLQTEIQRLINTNQEYLRGVEEKANAEKNAAQAEADSANETVKRTNALRDAQSTLNSMQRTLLKTSYGSKEYGNLQGYITSLTDLRTQFDQGKITLDEFRVGLSNIKNGFTEVRGQIETTGASVGVLRTKFAQFMRSFTMMFSAARIGMMVFRELREMVSSSIEIDASMRQLEIVTHASSTAMRQFGDDVADAAKRVGASITDMIDSATVFARIGFTLPDSQKLAEFTTMLQNVGDIDVADAQDAITSIVKAFDFGAGDIEGVMDKLIVVGNNFPISVSQIAEGMTNASSTLNAAGNTFEQSVALLTAANVTLQNAAKASTGLRTIAARIRNTKVELDELGETMTTAKYEQAVNILTSYQVRLTDINGEYRSTYDIMSDIATQWGRMTSMEQAALATTLAGTRQQDVFYSLINQFQEARGAMDAMNDSAGALTESYSTYMDSVQAHINQFNAARQQLSTNLMESGVLRDVVDIGTGLIEMLNAIDQIVDKIGGLRTVLVAISGIVLTIKADVIKTAAINLGSKVKTLYGTLRTIPSLIAEAARNSVSFKDTVGAIAPSLSMVQLGFAAITTVITIATIAISAHKRRVEEMRQAQHKAADEAAQSVDTINSLYNEYMQMNEAQENGTATTEELAKAQDNLIDALGLTKGRVQELTDQYGNLTTAMQIAAAEAMADRQRELQGGVQTYADELRDTPHTRVPLGPRSGIADIYEDLMADEVLGRYFTPMFDRNLNWSGGVSFGYTEDIEQIIEDYKTLGLIMDSVADRIGTDNDAWKALNKTYTEMGNIIGPMLAQIKDLNEAVVMEKVYRTQASQGTPLDRESFEFYRQSVIDLVAADTDFNTLGGSVEDVVDSVLRADAAFVQFYGDVTGADGTGGVGDVTQTVGDLAESVKNMAAAYKALESAKADMADGGGISAETLSTLAGITEDYMDYLYVENGVLKLNVDLWEQMAHADMQSNLDAIEEEQQHITERKAEILAEIEELNDDLANYQGSQPDTQVLDNELYDIDATTAEYTQRIALITRLEDQIATLNAQLYNEESDLKRNDIIEQIEATQRELAIIRQDDVYWDEQMLALAERREEIQKELDLIRGTNAEAYDAQDGEVEHRAEIQAQIDADEAALEAIAEREEELMRMREIYQTTLNEEPQTQAGQAMDEFATNIGTAKSAMDALASAEKDMADGGGLTASTIKTLAGITDNYTDYLYEENGVIKLNIEAWREYATTALQGRIDMLNAQLEALKTERDAMLQLTEDNRMQVSPDWSLEETDAEIQETTDAIGLYQAALNGLTTDTKEATDELATMTGALGDMSDAYDILATAEEEMQNGGSLSLNTIKALAGVTDEYIRFLKVENGVITLNTEAWKAYAQERQQAYLDGLEQRRAELEAQRQELQSQLNGETPATMSAEELATAIAEVDASIEGLDNEKAVYESVMEAIANGSDEATKTVKKLSTALSEYEQATSLIETANEEMEGGGISFDTLQSLMNATDDYIQFLYRENGQLKLNTEAYEEYARARAEEALMGNDEYAQLTERNRELESVIKGARAAKEQLERGNNIDTEAYARVTQDLAEYEQELAANNERLAIFDDMLNLITGDADQTSGAITGLTDAVSGLNDGLDILLQARREMRTEGGVSMETIRQMAQLTDDYIDYLYEENGVIKLNTEAWAEFATGGMQSDIEKTQARIEELQARRAELLNGLDQAGEDDTFEGMAEGAGALRDELAEVDAEIESETNKLAIYSTLYMDTVNSAIDAMDPYQEVLDGFSSVADTINSVTDAMQTLSDIQNAVADGFIMSLDEALKFAEVYPEILNNATVTADGQIQLNEDVVNAFISGKEAELQAQIDADIGKLEGERAVLEAKLQLAQAELQIAQAAMGGTSLEQEAAAARIDTLNAELEAMAEAGGNEAEIYGAAAQAMSENMDSFNTVAATTATDVDTNLSSAASNAATSMYNNSVNMVEALNGVTDAAHNAALAVSGVGSGTVQGSTVGARGSGGTGSAGKTYTANTGLFSKAEYTGKATTVTLREIVSDLTADIEGYTKAISQIDGQIATLQGLRSGVGKYSSGGGKGKGGGGGGKGGGGGGGKDDASNWFEEQYKLHQHLLAMDAEEVEDYLEWLNDAYKRAYEEGIIDLDSFYKYEEEVYKGLHDLFKDYLNDVEHEIEMRGNYNENGKMISLYRELIAAVEKEISAAREQGLDDTDDYIQELQDKWWSYTDAIKKIEDDLNNQAKSATDKLVDYRLKMLKQEISDEKDAIKERLNNLKAFYDEQKRLLKDARDEEKYLEEQAEKRKAVADIEAQLAQLSYDNSAWAQKKRLELEEELSNARKELDDFERDHAIEVAEEELDKLYELQKKELDSQTDLLDAQQKDAKALYEQALEDIRNGSVELYEEMIDWNNLYGDGIEDTIKTAWEEAYKALEDYKNLYGELWDDFNLANATGYSPDGGGWDSSVISGTNPANIPVRTIPPTETTQDTTSTKTYPYGKVSSTSGNLSNGSRGEGVKALQYALNELGFGNSGTQSLDGVFGAGTANAVKAFQKAMGISADGIVGPATKKKFAEQGYASGTRYATSGLHLIDELGSETIFESADGKRYKLFTGGEKVLNARASEFLYDFAMNGGEILTKIVDMALEGARPGFEPNVIHNEITMGDIIINGRADQSTVSELRRAQREAVDTMLKEFSRLGR